MKQLGMKEEEFVCLKALAFLHPEVYFILLNFGQQFYFKAKGLSDDAQTSIRDLRNKILKGNINNYNRTKRR